MAAYFKAEVAWASIIMCQMFYMLKVEMDKNILFKRKVILKGIDNYPEKIGIKQNI